MKTFEESGIRCLDLHGVRHDSVEIQLIDFCYKYQKKIPLKIICGNSKKMMDICTKSLRNHGIEYDFQRYGIIMVVKI
tara:strand:+ start:5288 stop:5521 length:234 start_codon:yes stop_codon:yes gene_type:complete